MSFVGNRKSVSTRSMEYFTNGQSWLPQNVVEPQDVQQPQNIAQSNPSIPDEWSKTIDLESFEIPDQGEYCMIHLRPFFIPSPPSRDVPSSDLLMSPPLSFSILASSANANGVVPLYPSPAPSNLYYPPYNHLYATPWIPLSNYSALNGATDTVGSSQQQQQPTTSQPSQVITQQVIECAAFSLVSSFFNSLKKLLFAQPYTHDTE